MSEITLDGLSFSGERYVPEVPGQLELEHFHRYILASNFAVGKHVLDIASGEGYGSELLASVAQSVVGVDVSEEAVAHATVRYRRSNLTFKVGDAAAIPLPAESVDIVVSFETIEHHDRHEEMLAEVKRVLRPGGLLVISSPNKLNYTIIPKYSNPYHVKELLREEFQSLLEGHFANVRLFGQRVVYGSLIVGETISSPGFSNYVKDDGVERTSSLQNPVYDIAFASDAPLPPSELSFYEQMHGTQDGATFLTHQVMERHSRVLSLDGMVRERDGMLKERDVMVRARDAQLATLNEAAERRDQEIAELARQIGDWRAATAALNQTVAEGDARISELAGIIHEIHASRTWKMLAGVRWYGLQRRRLRQLLAALPAAVAQTGGVIPLLKIGFGIWSKDGVAGVKAVVCRQAAVAEKDRSLPDSSSATAHSLQVARTGSAVGREAEILFVSHEASRTGAPKFLLDLIRVVKEHLKIKCTILLCTGGELEAEFRELGDVYVLASRYHVDALTLHALKQRNIRLVYANSITNGQAQKQLKELGVPILCHVHELEYSIERIFGLANLRRVLETTDYYLAGSDVVRRYLVGKQGIPEGKVEIGYPFIDVRANEERARSSEPALTLPADAVVIGACGTIGWRKGTDVFVQLANRILHEQGRRVEFVWIGGPLTQGDYPNLRYDAEQLGIAEHLHFPGTVSDHLRYLAQCDIFVLPSREDPFPLVVLDAASLGCPIVCFDQAGGAPEFVENDAGCVVPYLDVDQMVAAVKELVDDASLRQRLGERAREKVRERHDRAIVGAHMAELIKAHLPQ